MNRRTFMTIALWTSVGWAINPLGATVTTDPWKAKSMEDAIAALYGTNKQIQKSDKIKVKAPQVASNGGSVPIGIKTELEAKRVLVFQNTNPYALTGIFEVPEDALVDYFLKIKLAKEANITILIEDLEGNIYVNAKPLKIQMESASCEGLK